MGGGGTRQLYHVITVKFDHDCVIRNPKHQICPPVVRACAKEVTFPIAHMKTQEAFNEVFMLALSQGTIVWYGLMLLKTFLVKMVFRQGLLQRDLQDKQMLVSQPL